MGQNDIFVTGANVSSGGNAKFDASGTFDGSASGTNAAIISNIEASFDMSVYHEWYDGTSWQPVVYEDENANTILSADFLSQFNRIPIKSGVLRFRIESKNSTSGHVVLMGDERT